MSKIGVVGSSYYCVAEVTKCRMDCSSTNREHELGLDCGCGCGCGYGGHDVRSGSFFTMPPFIRALGGAVTA